jgi:hypothetical protein
MSFFAKPVPTFAGHALGARKATFQNENRRHCVPRAIVKLSSGERAAAHMSSGVGAEGVGAGAAGFFAGGVFGAGAGRVTAAASA